MPFNHRRLLAIAALQAVVMSFALPANAGLEEAVKALQSNDVATAEKELQAFAKERDPRAQFLLGLYVYGNPQAKTFDLAKAAPLLLDAAERGYTPAMIPLAGIYAEGKGVPKSYAEAYKWLLVAERWNVQNASQLAGQVAAELKADEIEKVKAAALAYRFKTK